MSEPVGRKVERPQEELAELRAERERFSRERPSLDDLVASGEYDGPYRQGDVLELFAALSSLRGERERQGLSLAEVADRSGIDKATLSRLENGKVLNPTLATLWKYANAVGMTFKLSAEKVPTNAG